MTKKNFTIILYSGNNLRWKDDLWMEKYNHEYGANQIQVLEGLEAVR